MDKDSKPAPAKRRAATQPTPTPAPKPVNQGSSLAGMSAAFLVGAAVGATAASNRPAACSAHVHLSLGDDKKECHHQADDDCSL